MTTKATIDKLFNFYNSENQQNLILFFRVGDNYEAYQGQAVMASKVLPLSLLSTDEAFVVSVPEADILSTAGKLETAGFNVRMIQYRVGDDFILPDIDLIKAEEEFDY